jgi:hypothetical protein
MPNLQWIRYAHHRDMAIRDVHAEWKTLGEREMPDEITRLSVNINSDVADALREVMVKRGFTLTETVRRAVAIYKLVEDKTEEGCVITVRDPEGRVTELVIT